MRASLATAIEVLSELEARGRTHVTPLLDRLLEDAEREERMQALRRRHVPHRTIEGSNGNAMPAIASRNRTRSPYPSS